MSADAKQRWVEASSVADLVKADQAALRRLGLADFVGLAGLEGAVLILALGLGGARRAWR